MIRSIAAGAEKGSDYPASLLAKRRYEVGVGVAWRILAFGGWFRLRYVSEESSRKHDVVDQVMYWPVLARRRER
jgi:hypothetical protein